MIRHVSRPPARGKIITGQEAGFSFLETLLALVILGIIVLIFLTGLTTTTHAAATTDELATGESIARSQMEWAQSASYNGTATAYPTTPLPAGKDYLGYSANITAQSLHAPDDGIQKVTVTVSHSGKQVFLLQSYKTRR